MDKKSGEYGNRWYLIYNLFLILRAIVSLEHLKAEKVSGTMSRGRGKEPEQCMRIAREKLWMALR